MRIHLFNHYHNGDLFLNEPIIRNLCKNNSEHTFTMFCNYNSYIFKDIPNLTISLQNPYPNGSQFYYFSSDILVINIWVYALIKLILHLRLNSYNHHSTKSVKHYINHSVNPFCFRWPVFRRNPMKN